jgi:transmembrane sensor
MSPNSLVPDLEVIDRYLAGDATAHERQVVDAWLEAHPHERTMLHAMRVGVGEVYGPVPEYELDGRVAAVVQGSMERSRRAGVARAVEKRRSVELSRVIRAPRGWIGIAVVLATILGAAGRTILHSKRDVTSPQYATHVGQRASITLRDGTRLTLAPQTRISVAADFGKTSRTIALSGEAYFDVSSSSAMPFVVRTGSVATRVLGTAFTVRRYATDAAVQIAVATGKVRANGLRSSAIISAGHAAQVTDSTAVVTTVTDLGQYTDWTEGQLVFKRTPVPIVLATIERWYGYQFRMTDSVLAAQRVSLTLNVSDSKEMLTAIKGLLEVDLAFDGKTVTLTPRRAPRPASTLPVRKDRFHPSLEMGR